MSVLITCPSLDPNLNVNGISSVVNFIINNNKAYEYFHVELGKRDAEKRGFTWGLRLLKQFFCFFKEIIIGRGEIIHFNYALNIPSIIRDTPIIFFARYTKCKIVIHLHGGEFLMKDALPGWVTIFLKYVLSGNDLKIVLSETEREIIIKKFNAKNIKVLANCVEINDSSKSEKIVNRNNSLRILFLGRIVKSKGIETIIDALKLIHGAGVDIVFTCAGTGVDSEYFTTTVQNLLGPKFSFLGILKGKAKFEVLKNNDVFILPSLFGEGLPMALLESMSYGLVPIITDDGSMKSVVTDNLDGFIVNKSSPEEIFSRLLELTNNRDLLANLSDNAKQRIAQHYNPYLYINQLNKIYESL